jgi:hypothetical protein
MKNAVVAHSVGLALAIVSSLCTGRAASAGLCGGDDRVRLVEGASFDTGTARLSPDQVAALRLAVYALRPKIGLGVGPACTGTAISEKLMLTAGHCVIKGGMKAYQKHLRPRPKPVDLKLVYRVFDKLTGADLALYARKSGTFRDYLPVDPGFGFDAVEPGDRFGFPAFPYKKWNVFSWPQKKLLFSPVSQSAVEDEDVWFGVQPCHDDPAGERGDAGTTPERAAEKTAGGGDFPWCRVFSCADFFDGNSGSPMLRFHLENGAETISVIAVGTVSVKGNAPDRSLSAGAVPVALLRDVLPGFLAPSR